MNEMVAAKIPKPPLPQISCGSTAAQEINAQHMINWCVVSAQ